MKRSALRDTMWTTALVIVLGVATADCPGQVFRARELFCTDCTLPWFADLDGDGLVDMVVVEDGWVGATINAGDTAFGDTTFLMDVPTNARVLLIGDADLDGGTDMLLHDTASSILSLIKDIWPVPAGPIVLDTGFHADYTPVVGYARRGRPALRIGHFDGDGLVDIFTTALGGGGKWYRNLGDATYAIRTIADNHGFPYDWDGDGDTDLLQDEEGMLSVSITVDSVMGLPPVPLGFSGPTMNTGQMAKADIDGNGTIDLAIAGAIVLRTPGGLNELLCCSNVDGFRFRELLDLDCDGALELLDANSSAGSVEMTIQDLSGTGQTIDTLGIADVYDIDIALADLDADGRTDLFFQKTDSGKVFVRWNQAWPPEVTFDVVGEPVAGEVVALTGGEPAGGLYTGAGVFGDSLYTSLVGPGSTTIVYSYQDPWTGCIGSDTATVNIVTGMDKAFGPGGPWVSPNPADGYVLISHSGERRVRLTLVDVAGRMWMDVPELNLVAGRPVPLSVAHLPSGSYHLRVFAEDRPARVVPLQVLH